MMNSSDIESIKRQLYKRTSLAINEQYPNMRIRSNEYTEHIDKDSKRFTELFYGGKTFYQISFYLRNSKIKGGEKGQIRLCIENEDIAKCLLKKMNFLNDKLKEITENFKNDMDKLSHEEVELLKIEQWDRQVFAMESHIGYDFGYCHIQLHERNKAVEDSEYEEQRERAEDEHIGEQPYGGAFSSWDDYYSWKNGSSFCR